MFNSLNEDIKKSVGNSETSTARLLLYAGAVVGAILAMWGLYAAVLYLE